MNSSAETVRKQVRFDSLTTLRGVAALGVVVFHVFALLPQLSHQVASHALALGYLWVDFFFLLSGFVLAHRYLEAFGGGVGRHEYRRFIVARFAKIYPAYITVLLCFVLLELGGRYAAIEHFGMEISTAFFTGATSLPALASNVFLVQALGLHDSLTWNWPGWSLSTEWSVYLIAPLLFLAVFRVASLASALLAAVALTGLWGLQVVLGRENLDITYDFGVIRCLLEFCAGMALYKLRSLPGLGTWLGTDVVAVAVLAAMALAMHFGVADVGVVALFALVILCLSFNAGRVSGVLSLRPLLFLGTISYSIYLVQALVLRSTRFYVAIYEDANISAYFSPTSAWYYLLFAVAASILLGAVLYLLIEKPMHKKLVAVFTRRD
jgi:peptidoglycan/LPS O-acetylase OafA/YrhL